MAAVQPGAPLVHENADQYKRIGAVKPVAGTNIINRAEEKRGDVEAGFAESDFVFEDTFKIHTVHHGSIEPHVCVCQWGADEKITLWVCNDGPHRLRKDLAEAMEIPLTRIRVVVPYIGGGYGGKGGLKLEPVAIALARKTNHRPVRVIMTREEVFTATIVRHAAVMTLKTGVKRDGTMVARQVTGYWDTGAYAEKGPTVVKQATAAATGPYRCPNIWLVGNCVYTNKVISGAWRGYGTAQVTWPSESQMDMIARRIGMDPVAFRMKNLLHEGDSIATGQPAHSVGVEECLRLVAKEIGWGERSGPDRGKGIALVMKNTKTPSGSAAQVVLNGDGSANVVTSAVEHGGGAKTVLTQIAAEELGLPMARMSYALPDTDMTPYDSSTTSSRVTFHVGNAVRLAAQDLKAQLAKLGAPMLNVAVDEVRVADGKVFVQADPSRALTYQQALNNAYGAGGAMTGNGFFYPTTEKGSGMWSSPSIFWMYGAQAVEVAVDRETGQVEVLRIAAAHDVGRAINPLTVSGQIQGGAVCGMGTALTEEVIIDEKGRVLNPNLHDYKMPTALDVPPFKDFIVEANHRDGPFGAKGLGEPVTCPTGPALANAIEDAVGVRITELPLSSERVLKALQDRQGA
jgi:carbon-monoxide dehydrogenase large subunit